MKPKRITAFMLSLVMMILMIPMIPMIPTTASAYTSNTWSGFYITASNNYNGQKLEYIKITDVRKTNKCVRIWAKFKYYYSYSYNMLYELYDFSCSKKYYLEVAGDTAYRNPRPAYINRNPGHSAGSYTIDDEHTHSGNCKFCGDFTEEHIYDNNCDTTCNTCGYARTIEHDYHEETCLLPKICKVCGGTDGEALGHDYENGYCTVCNAEEKSENVHIKTAEQLKLFAYNVNNGKTDISAVIEDDIDMSEYADFRIGTSDNAYSGKFDGNGYKLTIDLNGGQYSAPFSYTNGATVKNLTVDGSISAGAKFAASIVGNASGSTKLENCLSFVTINSSVSGDATHGGLVANAASGDLTIDNCAFGGSIIGANTQNCGGLVGWATVNTKISNSYVAAEYSINKSGSSNTIARNPGKVTVTNCYYLNDLGSTPSNATRVTKEQVESGEVAFLLNGVSGGEKWYQNIDNGNVVDKCPVPNSAHGTLYYGYADCNAQEPIITNTKINTKKYIKGHNGGKATCISPGYCVDCGVAYTDKNPEAHTTTETYYKLIDNNIHGKYHSCCKTLIEEENHNEIKATCTGITKCDICNSSYGSIDSTNHTGELKWVDTGYGQHEYKYTCCGAVQETAEHNIVYDVDDNADTIGVKCIVCDDGTDTWKSGNGTVTLIMNDTVYNGNNVEASYTATGFMYGWSRPVDISFKYCCVGGCKTAGTHTVEMHVGEKSVTKEFEIEKRPLTINKIRAFNKSYDMTKDVFVNTIDLDGIVIYKKGDYSAFDIKDSVQIDLSKVVVTVADSVPGDYGKAKVTNIALTGNDKDNYTIGEQIENVNIGTDWGDYQIHKVQIFITPNDQTLCGDDAQIDQTAYTVEGLDDIYTLSGEFLYEENDKIKVNTDKIKVEYNGADVIEFFDIPNYYTGNLVRYCANHIFNEKGFCATGECNSYEAAVLITTENCEGYGFKEEDISEYSPKYAIYNAGQLYWFADRVNNYNEYNIDGVLENDITVNEDLSAKDLKEWVPIACNDYVYYSGNFYGNGHTVSGLYCKAKNGYVGFFGSLGYYSVTDLHIANSYFEGSYAGGIAGYSNGATITKCSVADDVTVKGTDAGGLVCNTSGGTIENCFSLASVSGNTWGGLIGTSCSEIKNCFTSLMRPVGYNNANYGGSMTNVYYAEDTNDYTIPDDGGNISAKPIFDGATEVKDFEDGEIAYLLQGGVDEIPEQGHWDEGYENWTVDVPAYIPQIWGQIIGTDKYPTFGNAKVYEDEYNNTKAYRNEIDGNKIILLGADKKSATVVLNAAGTYTIAFADYDGNRLANVKTFEVMVTKPQAVRVTADSDFTLDTGDKIMLWDNFENLTPMCEEYEVK